MIYICLTGNILLSCILTHESGIISLVLCSVLTQLNFAEFLCYTEGPAAGINCGSFATGGSHGGGCGCEGNFFKETPLGYGSFVKPDSFGSGGGAGSTQTGKYFMYMYRLKCVVRHVLLYTSLHAKPLNSCFHKCSTCCFITYMIFLLLQRVYTIIIFKYGIIWLIMSLP